MGNLKSTMRQMKRQQNMKKLHHVEWCDKPQTFIKSSLPEEPTMKIRMCLDISSYSKHDPPLNWGVLQSWLDGLKPGACGVQQKDIVLKTTTADTGAQCFLLGRDHLPGLGLSVENLLRSEINLSCANSTAAVFDDGKYQDELQGGPWIRKIIMEMWKVSEPGYYRASSSLVLWL